MKVLFAVSNEEISDSIVKRYQKQYKEIISYKNVYYFNAILKEIQKDKSYDRIVISEELEAFTSTQYDQIDRFIFEKLDSISDEAANSRGDNTPIILICSDRRTKGEEMLVKLFGIGIYDALIGNDRGIEEVCNLIYKPRSKKEAKLYYKVEADEVKYQSENENDVSEQEIQNILAHYKKLGKNEDKYVTSFDNIVAQYNDAQLRIISKFLPLNVRAVLEEKSPKYQQIMSFNNAVSNSIRKPKNKNQDLGPSGKLLRPKNQNAIPTEPIVVPNAVNTNDVKKLTRNHYEDKNNGIQSFEEEFNNTFENDNAYTNNGYETNEFSNNNMYDPFANNNMYDPFANNVNNSFANNNMNMQNYEDINQSNNYFEESNTSENNSFVDDNLEDMFIQTEPEAPKRRGRPRKNPQNIEQNVEVETPKRRGRPRKNVIEEEQQIENTLPGFDNFNVEKQSVEETILPGFENIEKQETTTLPGFETFENNTQPQFNAFENNTQPQFNTFENNTQPQFNTFENNTQPQFNTFENNTQSQFNTFEDNSQPQNNPFENNNQLYSGMQTGDLSRLLTANKKIATFVGTSKNGTSFIVNNLAEYASSMGINVAILDATKNKNSYYIYTKNEEDLRKVASNTLENLVNGQAKGISVNRNLTVYTSLPEDREELNNVDSILETLVRVHDLILIDCDFDTPYKFFAESQEIYLVQSYDILTIQPLTAFLRELKAQNILDQNKIKILINKHVKVRGISEKTIVGGMSKYNDPAMSFMTDLFDVNTVKYMTIQFEQDIYTRYLESIINCDISIKGYSKTFMQTLRELSNWVYQVMPGNNSYRPQSATYNNTTFSSSMNNTLNQMKRKY